MAEDEEDKTFEASQQKLQRARDKGDLPRSPEMNALAVYLGAWLSLCVLATTFVPSWVEHARLFLSGDGWGKGQDSARALAGAAAGWAMILLAIPAISVLALLLASRGIVFAPQKIAPDLGRINPIKSAGQKFGGSGLASFLISLAKVASVLGIGYHVFATNWRAIAASLNGGGSWIGDLSRLLSKVIVLAVAVSAVFAAIDLLWKKLEFQRRQRMSRREVQDEHKDAEGDPHLKAARRQRAIDLATKQMLVEVGKADVVIVNPTHFAVALAWQRGSGRAPICVAKGMDEIAARIRERAREHKVPIWSDPPCARALHASMDIGQEIPREQFAAVATAIRFAENMREKARAGW